MNVSIKTADEIARMRVAGRLAAEVMEMIEPQVTAGVTTEELDARHGLLSPAMANAEQCPCAHA